VEAVRICRAAADEWAQDEFNWLAICRACTKQCAANE
jgi:hypothetical protein